MNNNLQSSIVIGIMCFLLSFGIAVQISSMNNEASAVGKANKENELRNMVISSKEDYNREYNKLNKKLKELEELRDIVSNSNNHTKEWSSELEKVNNLLGQNKVKGKGVSIKLKSGDFLLILNALNNAGVDAISINDNRITFFSDISNDGDILTIDGKILESPYEIKAIGGDSLYGAITMPGSYLDIIKNRPGYEVNVEKLDEVEIEKSTSILHFDYANNLE